ncbi:MAG: SpoIID/LytB domain-containing protein [Candidatus Nanopelagicales bacterium]
MPTPPGTVRAPLLVAVMASLAVAALPVGGVGALGADAPGSVPAESFRAPADGVFRLVGAGWGHGRGMSQWGAYQAGVEGRSHTQILAFYYPGTLLRKLPAASVRVLLSGDTGADLVVRAASGLTATMTKASGTRTVTLPARPSGCSVPATLWRARATRTGLKLQARCRTWRTVIPARDLKAHHPISFAVPGGIVGTQDGGVRHGYRGAVSATRTSSRSVRVVNTLPMESYLRAVLPAEVPAAWPAAALRAQAIAARSFAARQMASAAGRAFDVYDTIRSQVYPGAVAYDWRWRVVRIREDARTDAAISDTAGVAVTSGGAAVLTQYSSSNGGATAASPSLDQAARVDAWDARAVRNPRHSWTDSVTTRTLRARCSRAGQVVAIRVLGREGAGPWGGRITALRVEGTRSGCTFDSDWEIRQALGVNSSLFTIRR